MCRIHINEMSWKCPNEMRKLCYDEHVDKHQCLEISQICRMTISQMTFNMHNILYRIIFRQRSS